MAITLRDISPNMIGDSEALAELGGGRVAVVKAAVPVDKSGNELFTSGSPGHIQGTLTATVGSIATVAEVTNVPSVDLVDAVTEVTNVTSVDTVDTVTEVANVTSLDLVDLITRIAEITLVGQVSEVTNLPAAIQGPGNPVVDSYASAVISLTADTANQSIIAAPGTDKQIWIMSLALTANTDDGTITFEDGDGTALSGAMPLAQNGGFVVAASGNFAMPVFKVPTNKAFRADTATLGAAGWCTYAIVDVS